MQTLKVLRRMIESDGVATGSRQTGSTIDSRADGVGAKLVSPVIAMRENSGVTRAVRIAEGNADVCEQRPR